MKSGSTTLLRAPLIVRRSGTFYIGLFLVTLILFVFAPPSARARSQVKFPPPLKQDENCLACHGQAGMTAGNGKSISVDPGKHAASVHGTLGCKDCHQTIKDYPHPAKVAKVLCASCHDDEASHVPNSVHSALGEAACESCHGNHHEVAAAAQLLLTHLSLLFVPVGVGVITHLNLVSQYGVQLLAVIVFSTWIGMAVTALVLRGLLSEHAAQGDPHG